MWINTADGVNTATIDTVNDRLSGARTAKGKIKSHHHHPCQR